MYNKEKRIINVQLSGLQMWSLKMKAKEIQKKNKKIRLVNRLH